ncbi:Serine/threonine protein kinase [Gracilaria domingensis]|nr:Serine/threonine protein kinase [Gracilaria domingensis]
MYKKVPTAPVPKSAVAAVEPNRCGESAPSNLLESPKSPSFTFALAGRYALQRPSGWCSNWMAEQPARNVRRNGEKAELVQHGVALPHLHERVVQRAALQVLGDDVEVARVVAAKRAEVQDDVLVAHDVVAVDFAAVLAQRGRLVQTVARRGHEPGGGALDDLDGDGVGVEQPAVHDAEGALAQLGGGVPAEARVIYGGKVIAQGHDTVGAMGACRGRAEHRRGGGLA